MANVFKNLRNRGTVAWLMIANVAVFIVVAFVELISRAGLAHSLVGWLSLPGAFKLLALRPWTLLTYMFTHLSPLHLLFNMLWLGWFGYILLSAVSRSRLVAIYIGGGLSGGLLFLLISSVSAYPASQLLGASASVIAMMASAAVLMPDYTLHLFFIGDVKLKWVALFMIVLAFLGLGGGNSGGELAHIGGAVFGLAAGLLFRKKKTVRVGNIKNEPCFKPNRVSRVVSVMEQHRIDVERLDQLLDKIRVSGFDSLSSAEKKELRELSTRVQK